MGGEKRENGGRKVGQRLRWFVDGLGYKGDVGLGGGRGASAGEVRRVMALGGCRGILIWRVGKDGGSVGHAEGHGFVWGCNGV